ncbi:MAG: tRNA (adenosine(37)-N6)-threonylcarbamoyltransferase complex dimerization subunit type 1 TsaB, partial [Candidatus Gastranaerophilales bacterium]|nr:tRNA (adenosine(37)-N6)-threonylcarbamoyltransferase complex dimerization subunit type 1 TsaB [Candidatus Gastranaerophilales bacterium]
LGRDKQIINSKRVANTAQSYNSAFLASTVAEILRKNNLKMQDIDVIGANIGPGSFTGLRAGITTARVIAQQLGIPAVGIPSFQIYSHLNETLKNTFCIMDARRGMAYCGIYNKDNEPILAPCLMDYENALEKAQGEDFFNISDNRMAARLQEMGLSPVKFQESEADFGGFLVQEAVKSLQNAPKDTYTWAKLKPLYIQTPSITMPKK